MTTCETTAPARRSEPASKDGAASASDDSGPSRSCGTPSHDANEPPDAGAVIALEFEVCGELASGVDLDALQHLSRRAVETAAAGICPGGGVRVRLVGDDEMEQAHQHYCGVGGTTDVITFDLAEGSSATGDSALDVDLIVCVDEARRQAPARGHSIETELALYTLHGVLHALGYDDLDDASYERMHAREDEIFRSIGVGAAFGRGEQA